MNRLDNNIMRENILDAVIDCKKEAAGAEVSLAQISCRAGISERTLNRYFPDKSLLLYEAATKYLTLRYEDFARRYRAADKTGLNALERLALLVRLQIDDYRCDITNALMFVRAFTTSLCTAVYRALPVASYDAATRAIVIQCVEDGIQDGSIRRDASPVDLYLMISSNFNGLAQRLIYMYSMGVSEAENKERILLVFDEYLRMLREYLSPGGAGPEA